MKLIQFTPNNIPGNEPYYLYYDAHNNFYLRIGGYMWYVWSEALIQESFDSGGIKIIDSYDET